MSQKSVIMLLLLAISHSSNANPAEKNFDLFLVGGGLKTCSSMSKSNCLTTENQQSSFEISAKTTPLFQFTSDNIEQFIATNTTFLSPSVKKTLDNKLQKIARKYAKKQFPKNELRNIWQEFNLEKTINQLTDRQYYFLLDSIEIAVLDINRSDRLKEQVNLAASKNPFSIEIFQKFVTEAQKKSTNEKANILVITASARDPFEAVDFYLDVFNQAGANTHWLPIDAAWQQLAQDSENNYDCENLPKYQLATMGAAFRSKVYPDLVQQQLSACKQPNKLIEMINNADGIFINGGDQSLTVKSLTNKDGSDNVLLQLIKQKINNHRLILGGTSAGTAVMSGGSFLNTNTPMITNGTSAVAIFRGAKADVLPTEGCHKADQCQNDLLNDDLTYNSNGGLGLFPWGIMDTHFSERGRQGRLAKLIIDTHSRFGFGVDEATALAVTIGDDQLPTFEVIGQGGVFIVENSMLNQKSKSKIENNVEVNSYYLTRNDQANITVINDEASLNATLASWKIAHQTPIEIALINDIFTDENYQVATALLCQSTLEQIAGNVSDASLQAKVYINKSKNAESSFGAIKYQNNRYNYCSYANYSLKIMIE